MSLLSNACYETTGSCLLLGSQKTTLHDVKDRAPALWLLTSIHHIWLQYSIGTISGRLLIHILNLPTLSCGILEAFVRFLNWSMRSDNSFVAGTRLLQNILPFPSKSHMRPVYLSTLFMFYTTVVDNLMYRASTVQGEGNMGKWKPALSCSNNRNGIY